jgi:hypothetical protein
MLDEHPVVEWGPSSHPVCVRRVLLAAFAAFMVSAPAAHASCALTVNYGGSQYFQSSATVVPGASLSGGYIPGCNDTVAIDTATGARVSPLEGPTPVDLHRIPGVPVRVGVAFGSRAMLAPGYLPQIAGNPLSKLFRAAKPASCGRPWRLRGTVQTPPFAGAPVSLGGRLVSVTNATRATGLSRDGFTYLGAGGRVDATVRSCAGAIVADRLSRAA